MRRGDEMFSKFIGKVSINKAFLIYRFFGIGVTFHNGKGSIFIESYL